MDPGTAKVDERVSMSCPKPTYVSTRFQSVCSVPFVLAFGYRAQGLSWGYPAYGLS